MALIKDGVAYEASTIAELVYKAAKVELDYEKHTIIVNGVLDSITYSNEYKPAEFRADASRRVLRLLIKQGWRLFKEIE